MLNQSNGKSRREFVKNSTLIAGGILATPLMSRANYFSGADDTIKVSIIGCGGRGTGAIAQALLTKQNVKLVAMADVFKDNIDKCLKAISADDLSEVIGEPGNLKNRIDVPEERKFVGFDAYKKAIAAADVVLLTTPPGFRPQHFEECVAQGKHVFAEKPMGVDPAGIQKVLAAAAVAKQKKLNVVVGLQRHYHTPYLELLKRKDTIGDIVSAQAWWNTDGVWVRKRQYAQTEMEYQMRNWYYFNWLCGDHINEQHCHNLDVVNWFKGSYPVSAQGLGGRQVRKGKDHGEIFDHHYVEFTYADGSIMNSQCRQIPGTMSRVDEWLIGTKGRIYCDDAKIVDNKGKLIYQFDKSKQNNPYQVEHDLLFEAVAKGEYKFSDAENGAKSTMTAIMGRMATYSGQIIQWDKAINSGIDLMPKELDWNALPPTVPNEDGYYACAMPGTTLYL